MIIFYRCNSKSKHVTLVLLDLFRTGNFAITWSMEGMGTKPSLLIPLCFLMCPPRACPRENSWPQMEHSCILGLLHKLRLFPCSFSSSPSTFCLLWLALCPPSAWKDENLRLHVLHSNSRDPKPFSCALLLSSGQEKSIRHFAKSKFSDPSLPRCLFIATMLNTEKVSCVSKEFVIWKYIWDSKAVMRNSGTWYMSIYKIWNWSMLSFQTRIKKTCWTTLLTSCILMTGTPQWLRSCFANIVVKFVFFGIWRVKVCGPREACTTRSLLLLTFRRVKYRVNSHGPQKFLETSTCPFPYAEHSR